MSKHENCQEHLGDSPWCLWCEIMAVRSDNSKLREERRKEKKDWSRERGRFRQEITQLQERLHAAHLEAEGKALARIHAVADLKERAAASGR